MAQGTVGEVLGDHRVLQGAPRGRQFYFHFHVAKLRKGRAWAIAVRRGSYRSLFLPNSDRLSLRKLECRKWGFKRWGFKEIRGYLRKKAFFLRFLDFPGALQALRKRAKKAEKGRKRPISADFQEGRPDTP